MIHSSTVQRPEKDESAGESEVLAALRGGDEEAFVALVSQYHLSMLRIATVFVLDPSAGEEVVQEAWLGVLNGLDRFEGRSSLKTWIFSILTNCARTRRLRDSRTIPFSDLDPFEIDTDEPAVDPGRFRPAEATRWPGHWAEFPQPWMASPEEQLQNGEIRQLIEEAIGSLPANQQAIITMRDVEGWSAREVCNVLVLSETNQRVLLHRARSKVRRLLEKYFTAENL